MFCVRILPLSGLSPAVMSPCASNVQEELKGVPIAGYVGSLTVVEYISVHVHTSFFIMKCSLQCIALCCNCCIYIDTEVHQYS